MKHCYMLSPFPCYSVCLCVSIAPALVASYESFSPLSCSAYPHLHKQVANIAFTVNNPTVIHSVTCISGTYYYRSLKLVLPYLPICCRHSCNSVWRALSTLVTHENYHTIIITAHTTTVDATIVYIFITIQMSVISLVFGLVTGWSRTPHVFVGERCGNRTERISSRSGQQIDNRRPEKE
ncbi:hypothetical protein D915_009741 [Fasciola hepatica]|uniref:C2H2-type domain-containing protein n=1 Tax=Fasciola hepatica TaxID=6192 RepID=A0A4E0QZ32_FASHE|nr:hypothetical protein D915_009741 [Fasciola hepatica]